MRHWSLLSLVLFLAASAWAIETYREMKWEMLVPKGWEPGAELKSLNLSSLQDADPRAVEALRQLKEKWDSAPSDPSLAGARVRLLGYAIPLEKKSGKVAEFLLVPYFGACIHTPPPPANQIVHVFAKTPLGDLKSMDAVWVSGTLSLHHAQTIWGKTGYRMAAVKVDPYKQPGAAWINAE
jgi:hypothetical protein